MGVIDYDEGVSAARPIPLEQMKTFAEGLCHPEGVCITRDGTLYAGGDRGQLYRVEPDGTPRELLSTGGLLLGLAADASGRIYAVDVAQRCVWRIDPATKACEPYTTGSAQRTLVAPNWGAFGPDGSYYLSDSGRWGEQDGCLWRIPPGGGTEVWSEEAAGFPNGMAVDRDGTRLWVLESNPAALVAFPIGPTGAAGPRKLICDLPADAPVGAAVAPDGNGVVPDGIALAADGTLFVSCYQPDVIYRWSEAQGLQVHAEDPGGVALAAPTNIVFAGERRDRLVATNMRRHHLTCLPAGTTGQALHYPTAAQLGA